MPASVKSGKRKGKEGKGKDGGGGGKDGGGGGDGTQWEKMFKWQQELDMMQNQMEWMMMNGHNPMFGPASPNKRMGKCKRGEGAGPMDPVFGLEKPSTYFSLLSNPTVRLFYQRKQ